MQHVLLRDDSLANVKLLEHLILGEQGHQLAHVSRRQLRIAHIEQGQLFQPTYALSQDVHHRLQFVQVDQVEILEMLHFAQRSDELAHGFLADIAAFHVQRGQVLQLGLRWIE